jgi:hypothetical protein
MSVPQALLILLFSTYEDAELPGCSTPRIFPVGLEPTMTLQSPPSHGGALPIGRWEAKHYSVFKELQWLLNQGPLCCAFGTTFTAALSVGIEGL